MKQFNFKINGNAYQVNVESIEDEIAEVEVNGTSYRVELEKKIKVPKTPKLVRGKTPAFTGTHASLSTNTPLTEVNSPLPGLILSIHVKEGDTVKPDQLLVMMEAMKMENKLLAESGGVVKTIKIKPGDTVLQGQVIIELG